MAPAVDSARTFLDTGDYVHRTPRSIETGVSLLAGFRARLGAVAVLGNHEHWEGEQACLDVFRRIGLPVLRNERLFVTPGGLAPTPVPNESICVAGLRDLWEDTASFGEALAGVEASIPRIVLAHNPDTAELAEAAGHRVDLMCSGHTHGGQVSLPVVGAPRVPSEFGEKYAGGLCRGPGFPVLVSRGVGMAVLPVRFRVPPEISLIELTRA